MSGPRLPRLNHVAMSLPADSLGEEGRGAITRFYRDVFGWEEYDILTEDRKRLVLRVHTDEQFVFLIADDPPMTCPRLDHFGVSVAEESELDDILERARAFKARDDRVDIIERKVEDHGMIAITSMYVRYLLPMMVEVQWWDHKWEREGVGS